ncbi:MAG TPA: radical SAM protein, partial [Vicinamibacterales bacterium]|nr:radical SAM protein [Vicinamibacterales bacterium]
MVGVGRPVAVPELPHTLYLEATNRCDSECQTCVRTFRTLEPPADLSLAQVRAIVEQVPDLERVVLHGIGEPLLNREIFDIVAWLKTRGPVVLFNSDAISLNEKRARRLVEIGLDEYRVSMDAATARTYRHLRGVDQFDRVVANVRTLVGLQRALGHTSPRVSLWFTASRANLEELPAFVRLAGDLGVAEVYLQCLVFNGLGLATETNALHRCLGDHDRALLEEAERLAGDLGLALRASGLTTALASLRGNGDRIRPWSGCQRPWTL